jgi:hypothetical protein
MMVLGLEQPPSLVLVWARANLQLNVIKWFLDFDGALADFF